MAHKDFVYSTLLEPHRQRTRKILKAHPEIRSLIGKNPRTFVVLLFVISLQFGLAFVLRDQSWWLVLATAWLVGAFASHALFVIIHECAHNLIFKKKKHNMLAAILANLPQFIPSGISFIRYHIKHHAFQGVYELDGDLPSKWEARLIGNSAFGKAMWLLMFPFFQAFRTIRLKEIKPVDGWILLNWAAVFAVDALVFFALGPQALVYLIASFVFSIGLHPLGARWIQEHYLTSDDLQETYSYYGKLNIPALNVGYHNEHHDFPSVPWNKLPELKSTAHEYYDHLKSHRSWSQLLLQFITDPKISLFSRTVRSERGDVSFNDQSTPDTDLLKVRERRMAEEYS